MKKILSFLTIAAVALGMISCNDEQLSQFRVEIKDLSATAVTFEMFTADPEARYIAGVDFKNTFLIAPEASAEALSDFQVRQGYDVWELDFNLLPETEYVWYAQRVDEQLNPIGEIEYKSFKTPAIEVREPELEPGEVSMVEKLEGEVTVPDLPEGMDIPYRAFVLTAAYVDPETQGRTSVEMGLYGADLIGKFGTEQIGRSFRYDNAKIVGEIENQEPITALIYKADLRSRYDGKADRYIFEGYVTVFCPDWFYDEKTGEPYGSKLPFKAVCEKVIAKEK